MVKNLHKPLMVLAISGIISLALAVAESRGDAPQRQYQAKWIWAEVQATDPFQYVRFRKTFNLDAATEQATAFVTADTFYRLWINGALVMHGPARSSAGKITVDPVDVTQYLKPGKNTVVAQVFHGVCPFEALAQAPGFLCELDICSGGKRQVVGTDDSWQAAEINAWNRNSIRFSFMRGWLEDYDGRRESEEKWMPAIVLGPVGMAPWTKVELRDIPLPAPLVTVQPLSVVGVSRGDGFVGDCTPRDGRSMESRPDWNERSVCFRRLQTEHRKPDESAAANPSGLTEKGSGDAVLRGDGAGVAYDFGRGYVGFIGFEVTGKAGQVIEIAWNERLSETDKTARPLAQVGNNAIRYVLRDGRQSFLGFNPQFVRFLQIVHRGEGDVTVHKLGVTEFRFVAQPKGDFTCSDEELNRIYRAAGWTAALTTLDAFMDCPHRERNAVYGPEAYWLQKAMYSLYGDTSVMRRSIGYGADSVNDKDRIGPPGLIQSGYPMHLTSFDWGGGIYRVLAQLPIFWCVNLGFYERCSADTDFIRTMIPVMRKNLAAFDGYRNEDGLLEPPATLFGIFFDYTDTRTDGFSVALNARYVMALDEAARLERLVGDESYAAGYERQARQVRDALNRYCDGDLFYSDVLVRDAQQHLVPSPQACETTQYYVMWANVPPEERQKRMWQALRDDFVPTPLHKVQPIRGLTRGALYSFQERLEVAATLEDHAVLVRDTKAMFLPMVDTPPGTLWENTMGDIALCHSVACGIAGIMSEELLGIQIGLPLKITPHSGGTLRWCKGYITAPMGRVEVAWEWKDTQYILRVSLPDGEVAEVSLPPEAKAVWQSAPATHNWQDHILVRGRATIRVEPGNITVKECGLP